MHTLYCLYNGIGDYIADCLVDSVYFKAARFQSFNYSLNMFVAVGFGSNLQLYVLNAVQRFKLIVFQFDNIGAMVGQNLRDA